MQEWWMKSTNRIDPAHLPPNNDNVTEVFYREIRDKGRGLIFYA